MLIRRGERWCVMGKNGAGKTTLLRMVAGVLLDEPTNHLDLATKEMLVEALRDFEGTMLFVSHDRTFLQGLSNRVLELGGESGMEREPHLYPGSYVEYVERSGHEAPGVHA
jgi:ATPase subunit of ABC transporter with duplicated ATPase domains